MDGTGYVDESFRDRPNGCYVVAAAVVPTCRAAGLRQDLGRLFGGRRRRFHWHAADAQTRSRMLELIAEAELPAVAVSTGLADPRGQERARARCLSRLLWELNGIGLRRLVLESRQARNNQRDRHTILAAQRSRLAARDLSYEFLRSGDEPLLWTADAIASACTTAEQRGDGSVPALGSVLRRVRV